MSTNRPPRPCPICRQSNTNESGYCDLHEAEYLKRRKECALKSDQRRGSPSKRGYDGRWVKVRKVYLMEHPFCEQCQKEGRIRPAREVHHIKAISDGGPVYDWDNLMAVCRPCHQQFTKEQMRERANG